MLSMPKMLLISELPAGDMKLLEGDKKPDPI